MTPIGQPASVLCLGMVVFNRVFAIQQFPERPQKVNATSFAEQGGGPAATAAVAIAALGGRAQLCGRVGDDDEGEAVCRMLAAAGVSSGSVRRVPAARTATSAVIVSEDGERLLAAWPGTDLDGSPDWLEEVSLDGLGAVLVDSRWPQGSLRMLQLASARGTPTVLDADLGSREEIQPLVEAADHVIFSEPGLRAFTGEPDVNIALRGLAPNVRGLVAVTCGGEGVHWVHSHADHLPAFRVEARDTTGAGDVFHGVYALGIAEGRSIEDSMRRASAAAALKCRNADGWAGMPTKDDVSRLLRLESLERHVAPPAYLGPARTTDFFRPLRSGDRK